MKFSKNGKLKNIKSFKFLSQYHKLVKAVSYIILLQQILNKTNGFNP